MGERRYHPDHRWHIDREQNYSHNSLVSHRRDQGKRQTDRYQGRRPESPNDSEELAEGKVALLGTHRRGAQPIISDPRT